MRNRCVGIHICLLAAWLLVGAIGSACAEETTVDSPGPGTFTVPDNVREVTVEVWGGGGAGGDITSRGATGGGGGGAYARSVVAVEPGNLLNYMVGGGGASGQVAIDSWVNLGGNELARAEAGASVSSNSSNRGRGGRASASTGNRVVFSGGAGADGVSGGLGEQVGGGGGSSAGTSGSGNNATGIRGASGPNGAGSGGDGSKSIILGQGSGNRGGSPGGGGGGSTALLPVLSGNYTGAAGGSGQVTITHQELPLLDSDLANLTIYSGAAITMGASSTVGGNIQVNAAATLGASSIVSGYIKAGAAVTLGASVQVGGYIEARDAGTIGADSTIGGNLTTGDAATLGANTISGNIMVGGNLTAGAAILVGAKAVIGGNLRSGAAASADLGADAMVGGNATAGTALTLGAGAKIGTNPLSSGNAQAGTGALMLGVGAMVAGNAKAGTSVTLADMATVGGIITAGSVEQFTNDPKKPIDDKSAQLVQVQRNLAAREAPLANQLPTSLTVDKTLTAGIYHTTALSTTAGITLTFDGKGVEGHWIINSDSFIAFGASTKMVLKDVAPNSTIIWNTGGYTSAGASSNLIGTFFAGSYILTGEFTTLQGAGGGCGNLYATTGAVTLGASNAIGLAGCMALPTAVIDHFQIVHDGQGLTCKPETIIINACTNVYDGTCTLSDETVTLNVIATGSGSVTDRISFTGTGTARIPYTRAEPASLSLGNASIAAINPTVCFNGSNISCDLVFAESGFSLTIPNHISGQEVQATILAVKAGEENPGQCVPAFTVEKNIEFTTVYQNPATGTLAVESGGDLLNGNSLTLDFDSSGAASFLVQYTDVGRVLLKARYEGAGDDAGLVMLGEGAFVARPDHFKLTIPGNPAATSVQDDNAFVAAGADFEVRVSSINALGDVTPNFGRETSSESVALKASLVAPAGGDSPPLTGAFGVFGEDCSGNAITGGKACGQFQWPEVGIISIMASLQSGRYLGTAGVVGDEVEYVGRFIPDRFNVVVAEHGEVEPYCTVSTAFAYMGQNLNWKAGVQPMLTLEARNGGGNVTRNYTLGNFQRLLATDLVRTAGISDVTAIDAAGNPFPVSTTLELGGLSVIGRGRLQYLFSLNDEITYSKTTQTRVPPLAPDYLIELTGLADADDVSSPQLSVAIVPKFPLEMRYGRLQMENAYGPETSNLKMPFQAEFYTASGFIINSADGCWSYNTAADVALDQSDLSGGNTSVIAASGILSAGAPEEGEVLILKAPGANNQGDVIATFAVPLWLQGDWNQDGFLGNPQATATFGVYRGNDRVIYWREVFNN